MAGGRDLVWLLGAGLVSQTGDWLLTTAVAYQVYVLTGSTLASAAVLLATQVPQVVLGSAAGVLVDRWDRWRVMVAVNVALAAGVLPLAAVRDAGQVWLVWVVLAVGGCLSPFFAAAEAGLLPALVARPEMLVRVNSLNAQVRNTARLVGAALGGVVVAAGGLRLVAGADALSFLVAAGLLAAVRYRAPVVRLGSHHRRFAREWVDGLTVVRGSRALLTIAVFALVTGTGEGVMGTLFAPFVRDVLGAGADAYGLILSVQAVGGVAGGLVVATVGHRLRAVTLFGWGAVLFGGLDAVLFLYPLGWHSTWPAVVVIALVGLPGAALFAGQATVFQTATTPDNRSRVFGAVSTVSNAAMLGAAPVAGALAGSLGVLSVITAQAALHVVGGLVVAAVLRLPARVVRRHVATGSG